MADFGLFFDVGFAAFDGDDVAQKLFVDDAENVVADGGEIPRAVGRVQSADEIGQDVVGDD